MTHTELIAMVADAVGASYEEAHGFAQTFIDIVIRRLDAGDEVKIRGLGTFKWAAVKGKKIPYREHVCVDPLCAECQRAKVRQYRLPDGKKLRFIPSTKLRKRRDLGSNEKHIFKPVFTDESFKNWKADMLLPKRRKTSTESRGPSFDSDTFKSWKKGRSQMPDEDEGMNKYAVVTEDQDDSKTAGVEKICPICGETLDSGGACPKHGTEPFEPND